jgi:thiamine pyrophosphate-dependent acetolactate synthase large subunit-like protein
MPDNKKTLSDQTNRLEEIMMQAIRQIIETKKLKDLIDIPDDFSYEKVEIIIFPVLPADTKKTDFKPEQFFGVNQLEHVDQLLETIQSEFVHRIYQF